VIDRKQSMLLLDLSQHLVDGGHMRAADPKVDQGRGVVHAGMPTEGRDLTTRHQQQVIEVGLQLAHVVILRDGVVIADRNEVQAACDCGFSRLYRGQGTLCPD
jgi:hypothetical protein